MANCRKCEKPLCRENTSGQCRACNNADPEFIAKRGKAIKRAFDLDPAKRERQRRGVAESNRRPERRKQSGEQAKRIRLWEYGQAGITDEVRQRMARTLSDRRLAHIPLERREEYKELAKHYGAAEAARLILDHQKAVLRRGRGA